MKALPFYFSNLNSINNSLNDSIELKCEYLNEFSKFTTNNFSFLHLNIQSLSKNTFEITEILDLKEFDIVMLSETFLTKSAPTPKHASYNNLRFDRTDRAGGGLLIYLKKQIKIAEVKYLKSIEAIQFSINVNKKKLVFLYCYKAPDFDKNFFIEQLEELLVDIDNRLPIFIVGDLNMDLLKPEANPLYEFIINNSLANFVAAPTRTQVKFFEKTNKAHLSSTLLDVIIANNDLISATKTIKCPFSDHEFVLASLNLPSNNHNTCDFYYARKLDDEKIALISNKFDLIDFSFLNDRDKNVEAKWMLLKENLLSLIDDIAPIHKLKVTPT